MNYLALCLLGLCLAGCNSTIVPQAIEPKQASFDGNDLNSGIIGQDPAGRGYIITAHARERYNLLVDAYGRDFTPPLARDAGISALADGTALIDREHLVKFLEMARWKKANLAPTHLPKS
jgi:hypothetical protein